MNCLILQETLKNDLIDIIRQLESHDISVTMFDDPICAIQNAQKELFDIILIDARLKKIKIENAIRLLKGVNPKSRIIVKADSNSKQLETRIRREGIYYYFINSFGTPELLTALYSAVGIEVLPPVNTRFIHKHEDM
jgi:CheY-like chemotaxis protein